MTFDQLWAGWRSDYVNKVAGEIREKEYVKQSLIDQKSQNLKEPEHLEANNPSSDHRCIFCAIASVGHPNKESHLIHIDPNGMALLNAYPYGTGHMLIMPKRHVGDISELSEEEHANLWKMCRRAVEALRKTYDPDGFNMGANLGRAAGAGIPEHLHFHVLPRWDGDTSFMTSIASTRVLPESLDVTFEKISSNW